MAPLSDCRHFWPRCSARGHWARYEALRRKTYTTPTSFLELMNIFLDLFAKLKDKLGTRLERYTIGAQKMSRRALTATL